MASNYEATNETSNYVRLCRIYVELLRDILWEVVQKQIHPTDIKKKATASLGKVKSLKSVHHRLNSLRSLPGGRDPINTDFDISLLYFIIRNMCSLPSPSKGWGKSPTQHDLNVADDVERIHSGRNEIYGHSSIAAIAESDFKIMVQNLRDLVGRLDSHLNTKFITNFEGIIGDIMDPVTQQMYQRYVLELLEQRRREMELSEKIEETQKELSCIKENLLYAQTDVGKVKEKLEGAQTDLEKINTKLENTQAEVRLNKKNLDSTLVEVKETKEKLQLTNSEVEKANVMLDITKTEVKETKQKLQCTDEELGKTKVDLENTKAEVTNTKQHLQSTDADVKETQQNLKSTQAAVEETKKRLTDTFMTIKNAKEELEKTQAEVGQTKTRLVSTETEVEKAKGKLERTLADVEKTKVELDGRVTVVEKDVGEIKTNLTVKEHKTRADEVEFKRFLVKQYLDELSKVKILRWFKAIDALKLFKPLVIREDIKERLSQEVEGSKHFYHESEKQSNCQITCYSKIFYTHGCLQQEIYLLGEAGIGKTTFCNQLVNLWCKVQAAEPETDYERMLCKIEYVFYVRCRFAKKSESVLDMIKAQLCPLKYGALLEMIFTSYPEKCLVLLDGLDEWCGSATDESKTISRHGLPDTKDIYGCTVLTTSRPWRIEALDYGLSSSCRVLEIQGLDTKGVFYLSTEMLKASGIGEVKKAAFKFIKLVRSQEMKDIIQIPLMLIILVMTWQSENQTLDKSMCRNFAGLLESVMSHSGTKINTEEWVDANDTLVYPTCFSGRGLCLKFRRLIQKLSKLAFSSLLSKNKENSLVFSQLFLARQIGEEDLQMCLDLGILSESKAFSQSVFCEVSISFLHKSVQEFLAAVYFSANFDDCFNTFRQNVTSVNEVFDLKLILIFLSGMVPSKFQSVCRYITNLADQSQAFKTYRSYAHLCLMGPSNEGLNPEMSVSDLQELLLQCNTEAFFSKTAQAQNLTESSLQRSDQILQYTVSDVTGVGVSDDMFRQLFNQGEALKLLTFLKGGVTGLDSIESVQEMKQIEKLCVKASERNLDRYIASVSSAILQLGKLQSFGFCVDVAPGGRPVSSSLCVMLLEAFEKMPRLESLWLQGLDLSFVGGNVTLPSHCTSVYLRNMHISGSLILPKHCAILHLQEVTVSSKLVLPHHCRSLFVHRLTVSSSLTLPQECESLHLQEISTPSELIMPSSCQSLYIRMLSVSFPTTLPHRCQSLHLDRVTVSSELELPHHCLSVYLANVSCSSELALPPDCQSLGLSCVTLSQACMSTFPLSLISLEMTSVSLSPSVWHQLCRYFSVSTSLENLKIFPSAKLTITHPLDLASHQTLYSLQLLQLELTSGLLIPQSLRQVYMFNVNMPEEIWKKLLQHLSRPKSHQLRVRLSDVNITDETLSYISQNFTITNDGRSGKPSSSPLHNKTRSLIPRIVEKQDSSVLEFLINTKGSSKP